MSGKHILFAFFTALFLLTSCAENEQETEPIPNSHYVQIPDAEPGQKRVLGILGDAYHPAAYLHRGLFRGLIEEGWQTVTVLDYINVPWDDFDSYDLIVMCRHGLDNVDMFTVKGGGYDPGAEWVFWLTEEQEEKFVDYVEGGGGLLLFHDGIGHYKCGNGITRLGKACFETHPPSEEITVSATGIMPELTKGVTPFKVVEEEFVLKMDESDTNVFLESYSEANGRTVQGWAHEFGEGKVVVLIPGHEVETINHPMIQQIIGNSIAWLRE